MGTKCRPSEMTDEEARAEFEQLRAKFEEADRDDAPLLAICWHDDDEPVVVIAIKSKS